MRGEGEYKANTSAAPGAQKAAEVKDNETTQAPGKLPRKRQQLGIAPLDISF
jgi:hypothetical protein